MKATLFSANQKAQKTIEMEKLVGLIRNGYKEKQVAALREELRYTIPGVSVKEANRLPVVYFCSTVKKQDGTFVRDQYNGLVLLKINNLANCNEAKNVRRQAAGSLQTMAAFIGSSGKSVKIIIPFTLPDHTVPQNDTLIRFFMPGPMTERQPITGKSCNNRSLLKKMNWMQPADFHSIRIFTTIRTPCLSGSNNLGRCRKSYRFLHRHQP